MTEKSGENNAKVIALLISEANNATLSKVTLEVDKINQLTTPYEQHLAEVEYLLVEFKERHKA